MEDRGGGCYPASCVPHFPPTSFVTSDTDVSPGLGLGLDPSPWDLLPESLVAPCLHLPPPTSLAILSPQLPAAKEWQVSPA